MPEYNRLPSYICLFSIAVLWAVLISTAWAERTVTLAWNPSADTTVTGYNVYMREEGSATPVRINAGAVSQTRVGGLKEGLRYTFTVTAYNAAGIESVPSNEAIYTVPVPLKVIPPPQATGFKRLQFPIAPGRWYEVQASTNLQTWATIWQTGIANTYSWMEFQDPQSAALRYRYYRLKINKAN